MCLNYSPILALFLVYFSLIPIFANNFYADIAPPIQELNDAETLDEKFEIIWNSSYMKKITNQKGTSRNTKNLILIYWLSNYDLADKNELVNMYDKMLVVQNKMKNYMKNDDIRLEILEKEVRYRKEFDEIVDKQSKMKFIAGKMREVHNPIHNYYVYLYFLYDVNWQQEYETKTTPMRNIFIKYYFSNDVMKVLNSSLSIDKKLEKINYDFPGKSRIFEQELMEEMYRKYLENGTI